MRKTTRLRRLIEAPDLLVMPGVYDPVSAMLVQEAGFPAAQCTGFGIAASTLGAPDVSVVSMGEMAERTRRISRAIDIPVMADADTGFGNAINVHFTAREFEAAGAAGLNLEDQVMPKRCGHLAGKEVVPVGEMLLKLEAARDALADPDFVINARTDALAVEGIEGAIDRGNAYLKGGANMAFIDGVSSLAEVKALVAGIDGPVAVNLVEGGRTEEGMTLDALAELGVARVSLPLTTFLGAMKGMRDALAAVNGARAIDRERRTVAGFDDALALVGMTRVFEMEKRYILPDHLLRKYGAADAVPAERGA